ncbi:ABC transporter permease [Geodermatophilus sabuli]|uniref:ABC transporter permease n=1 Tax=Geodermatophilus sabuli TaxID=1564158 RepID=A0A7K3W524_9ACTN|nr:ABC transporter permease [Geodermatophilus sabuli]NEK59473.1 ABC transporter permease [Geodermatophilus sabuli]
MWRATLRNLLAHKLRLALSGLAIVLGVAFVSGTMIFTDTLSKTFDDLFSSTASDVNVEAASAFDSGLEGSGAVSTVSADAVDEVLEVEGVAAAAGYVQAEGVYVLDRDGAVLDTGGAPGIGISWEPDRQLSSSTLVDGRAPEGPAQVALDVDSAEKAGYALGDSVPVLTTGPRVEAELVGVFTFGDTGGSAGASLAAFDTATAQELFGEPGRFDGISVLAADGVTDAQLRDRVAAALGDGYTVRTADEQAAALAGDFQEGLAFVEVFLLAFAGIALFVGTFIILNTFSMLVAQRTRELALLRALGAGRAQVTRSVLAEALVLGVVGSAVGLAGGFGVAAGLRGLFGSFGLTLDGGLVFALDTVVWAVAVGVLVTVTAAYLPARRAAKTPPVAAMRDDHVAVERSLFRRTVVGSVVAVAGGAALVAALVVDDGSTAASLVGLGALALLLGAIALSPVLARPFLRGIGAALPRLFGTAGRLARENAVRNPRRTAATASALMVGLALVSGFSIIGASTSASVDALVEESLGADYVVSTAVGAPFSAEIAEQIRGIDGVEAVTQQRFGQAAFDGAPTFISAIDADTLDSALVLDYVSGGTEGLRDGGLLVDEDTAASNGWSVGDSVPAVLANGRPLDLTLGGIYAANQAAGTVVVSLDAFTAAGGEPLDRFVYVDLAADADAGAVRSQLEGTLEPYPVVTLKDQAEFAAEQRGFVDQLLLIINALLALSVIIAVLGIVNTLALSVIERTREIGLLRAIGMDRRQLRSMVRLESVVISVYGAVMGLVLGTVLGLALVQALATAGISRPVVPAGRMLLFLAVGAVIGVLAAVWPARRAARLRVLDAVATA